MEPDQCHPSSLTNRPYQEEGLLAANVRIGSRYTESIHIIERVACCWSHCCESRKKEGSHSSDSHEWFADELASVAGVSYDCWGKKTIHPSEPGKEEDVASRQREPFSDMS